MICLTCIFSCATRTFNPNNPNVIYSVAKNYYVDRMNNQEVIYKKISSYNELISIFGLDPKTDKNGDLSEGKPTEVDFSKNYVIGLIAPQSYKNKEIIINNIIKNNGNITINYSIKDTATPITSRFAPFKILIIDRRYDGNISLNKL